LLDGALPRAGTFKGFEKKYPIGFWEVDGVPLVDVYGSSIKLAEMLVAWKRLGIPWVSRVYYYSKVTPAALACGKDVVKDVYGGHWDY
jgi:hypothetical protein